MNDPVCGSPLRSGALRPLQQMMLCAIFEIDVIGEFQPQPGRCIPMPPKARTPKPPAKFWRIVDHARKNNPFYAEWLSDPKNIPILDRKTFLANNDKILNGNKVLATTSGSTGMPVRISKSEQSAKISEQDTERFVQWIGGHTPVVQIYHHGDKPPDRSRLDINAKIPDQIEYLLEANRTWQACSINTYPTNAVLLAQHILDKGVDMSCYTRIVLMGEQFESGQRAIIESAFTSARVWSNYSSMEFGMISAECPHNAEFQHIMADKLFIEVVDEDGHPCVPGQVGRIIATDYYNTACPFIRYELGDLAAMDTCPCGWIKLPAFSAIHGKVRGALLHRSGQRVMFTDLSIAFCAMREVKQYQVIQETLEDFTVKVATTEKIDEKIREAIKEHFGYMPNLKIEYLDHIPREKSGKFHAAICKV